MDQQTHSAGEGLTIRCQDHPKAKIATTPPHADVDQQAICEQFHRSCDEQEVYRQLVRSTSKVDLGSEDIIDRRLPSAGASRILVSGRRTMKSIKDLKKHILSTYVNIRYGLALIAIALPFYLWLVGYYYFDVPLQGSMSAYYHAHGGVLRDEFVGALILVAGFLYLYKGFTDLENLALNLAGIFLLIVALVPMQWACQPDCGFWSVHGAAAILFFAAIAYVCLFRATDTLPLMQDREKAKWYARIYKGLGMAMVASPIVALVLVVLFRDTPQDKTPWVFFVEAVGVVVFGAYWLLKSREISHTHAEERSIEGDLRVMQTEASDLFKTLPVEPTQ